MMFFVPATGWIFGTIGELIATVPKAPKTEGTGSTVLITRLEELGDVVGDFGADVTESKVDVTCKSAHPSCRGEGNQSNHKRVLYQAQTIFASQAVQHHGYL